jgi:hypothetical protein
MPHIIMVRLKSVKMKKPGRTKIQEDGKKTQGESKRLNKREIHLGQALNICGNFSCRMRKAGCRGFEGCPGYLAK